MNFLLHLDFLYTFEFKYYIKQCTYKVQGHIQYRNHRIVLWRTKNYQIFNVKKNVEIGTIELLNFRMRYMCIEGNMTKGHAVSQRVFNRF